MSQCIFEPIIVFKGLELFSPFDFGVYIREKGKWERQKECELIIKGCLYVRDLCNGWWMFYTELWLLFDPSLIGPVTHTFPIKLNAWREMYAIVLCQLWDSVYVYSTKHPSLLLRCVQYLFDIIKRLNSSGVIHFGSFTAAEARPPSGVWASPPSDLHRPPSKF